MDLTGSGELAPSTVIGPAVIGSGQFLCWKPCCKDPVRLDAAQFERWLPVAVVCDRPRCRRLWTVEFPELPPWEEAVAVWRPQRHDGQG